MLREPESDRLGVIYKGSPTHEKRWFGSTSYENWTRTAESKTVAKCRSGMRKGDPAKNVVTFGSDPTNDAKYNGLNSRPIAPASPPSSTADEPSMFSDLFGLFVPQAITPYGPVMSYQSAPVTPASGVANNVLDLELSVAEVEIEVIKDASLVAAGFVSGVGLASAPAYVGGALWLGGGGLSFGSRCLSGQTIGQSTAARWPTHSV